MTIMIISDIKKIVFFCSFTNAFDLVLFTVYVSLLPMESILIEYQQ